MKDLFLTSKIQVVREAKMLKIIGEEYKKIPVNLIRSVYSFGNVEITPGARNLLLEYGKSIYFFSHKAEFRGVLHNAKLQSNYTNRLLQYKYMENLELAKFIINYKIETIETYTKKSLQRYKDKLSSQSSLNEILGTEGASSIYMFEKIKEKLKLNGIDEFKKREYRPVKDRINGLLSFIYTLYYSFLHTIIVNEGFDPYIGFLHKKRGKHMAFVSDVIEGYRVVLSAFVVELYIKELNSKDFEGLYLTFEGRRKFIRRYIDLLEHMDHYEFLNKIKDRLYQLDN